MAMIAFSNTPHGKKKNPSLWRRSGGYLGTHQYEGTAARSCSAEPVVAATTGVFYLLESLLVNPAGLSWQASPVGSFPNLKSFIFLNTKYFWLIKYLLLSLLAKPLCTRMNRKYACSSSSWAHAKNGGGPGWDGWVMWRDGSWKKAGCYAWAGCRWGGGLGGGGGVDTRGARGWIHGPQSRVWASGM